MRFVACARGVATLLAVACAPSVALAQHEGTGAAADVGGDDTERSTQARSLFVAGQEAFAAGRFADALRLFEQAYELSPRPELLYNVAVAHDRLGHDELALSRYEAYLATAEAASNRAYTESRVAVLRERLSGGEPDVDEPTPPPAPQVDDEASTSPPLLPIILFSIAGVAGLTGLGTGIATLSKKADLDERCSESSCPDSARGDVDALRTLSLATDVLLGVSAVAAATALVALLLAEPTEEAPVSAGLACTSRGCDAVVQGRF